MTRYCYIELNPVRAGMLDYAAEYPWSGFGANGQGEPNSLLTPHQTYLEIDHDMASRITPAGHDEKHPSSSFPTGGR